MLATHLHGTIRQTPQGQLVCRVRAFNPSEGSRAPLREARGGATPALGFRALGSRWLGHPSRGWFVGSGASERTERRVDEDRKLAWEPDGLSAGSGRRTGPSAATTACLVRICIMSGYQSTSADPRSLPLSGFILIQLRSKSQIRGGASGEVDVTT